MCPVVTTENSGIWLSYSITVLSFFHSKSYDFIFSSQSSINSIDTNSNHLPNATPPTHGWLDGQNSNSGNTQQR